MDLTINFYRRNYIEGLFLSLVGFSKMQIRRWKVGSAAAPEPKIALFNGYIHLKSIPGASDELMKEAGLYADRLSINIEIPTEKGLKLLAPDKSHAEMMKPMDFVKTNWFL